MDTASVTADSVTLTVRAADIAIDITLDHAWAEAEAAMPEGWVIRALVGDGAAWNAIACSREAMIAVGMDSTPIKALIALAANFGNHATTVAVSDVGADDDPAWDRT